MKSAFGLQKLFSSKKTSQNHKLENNPQTFFKSSVSGIVPKKMLKRDLLQTTKTFGSETRTQVFLPLRPRHQDKKSAVTTRLKCCEKVTNLSVRWS